MRVNSVKQPEQHTEMLAINKLLTFLTAEQGNTFVDVFDVTHTVSEGQNAVIFTTRFPFPARVIHTSESNPYWNKVDETPPQVGSVYHTAGEHALLAVDYQQVGADYEIFFIDPQTGCVIAVNTNNMVEVAKQNPDFQNESVRNQFYGLGTGVL